MKRRIFLYLIMFFAFENLITFIEHNPNHPYIICKVKHRTMMNGSNLDLFDVKHVCVCVRVYTHTHTHTHLNFNVHQIW
jgi:hypothetical protein